MEDEARGKDRGYIPEVSKLLQLQSDVLKKVPKTYIKLSIYPRPLRQTRKGFQPWLPA